MDLWTISHFITFIFLFHQTVSNTILNDSSFENEVSDQWTRQHRTSMWDVKIAPHDVIVYDNSISKTGNSSLKFNFTEITSPKSKFEVYVSQYCKCEDTCTGEMNVGFWTHGQEANMLELRLYVRYVNGQYMIAELRANSSDTFVYNCLTIPNYGTVDAFMIHFVLKQKTVKPIYLDDISLDFVSLKDYAQCPLYSETFPNSPTVLTEFLKPNTKGDTYGITLATQLTFDRLSHLKDIVKRWKGPVSASVLLFEKVSGHVNVNAQQLIKWYETSDISKHLTVHIVIEDLLNKNSESLYPVNFLRNIAIGNAKTSHVYFMDVDIEPAFSSSAALHWMESAISSLGGANCPRCSFITPVFHIKKGSPVIVPSDKQSLIDHVFNQKTIEPFLGTSHSVVKYRYWYNATEPYEVKYSNNMEPYFIVPTVSPLMNDLFAGYGRDKCAYSRDLHHNDYKFYVLPEAYVVNKPEDKGSSTIYARSKGLHLGVFLNTDFHLNDLKRGYTKKSSFAKQRIPSQFSQSCTNSENEAECKSSSESDKYVIRKTNQNVKEFPSKGTYSLDPQTKISSTELPVSSQKGHITCQSEDILSLEIPEIQNKRMIHISRKDILIEDILKENNLTVYIEFPQTKGSHQLFIPMVHMDAIVNVVFVQNGEKYNVNGAFETYLSASSSKETMVKIKHIHPAGSLTWVNGGKLDNETRLSLCEAALLTMDHTSIVVIENGTDILNEVHQKLCSNGNNINMIVHKIGNHVIFKSAEFVQSKLYIPRVPSLVFNTEKPECDSELTTTDIILMTKNRPMQTLGFLESLMEYVHNINTVWLLYRADADIIAEAYTFVVNHIGEKLNIVQLSDKGGNLGENIKKALTGSPAQYVMFAVDEMIWLRPVDLNHVGCILHKGEGNIGSFQLRLGTHLGPFTKDIITSERFHEPVFDRSMYVYYPHRMPYDVGYVINVDGMVTRIADVLYDLEDGRMDRIRSPGYLESGWIHKRIHIRSKQWAVMYKEARVTNNVSIQKDKRVSNLKDPEKISEDMAKMLLHDRRKIDVLKYAADNQNPVATHTYLPVQFVDF